MPNPELRKRIRWLPPILVIILLLILGGICFIFYSVLFPSTPQSTPQFEKAKSEWQAVFLRNGEVYFGHVVETTDNEVVLRDVYYIQTTQPLQGLGETQGRVISSQAPLLVKLGSEPHKPYDEMRINRDQVFYIEDLQSDSPVVEAIKQYQSSQ